MHFTLKLTQIGNSVGVILPKEALAAMKLEKGDAVHLTESPDGFQLTPYDPGLAEQLLYRADVVATTMRYLHLAQQRLTGTTSPLDLLTTAPTA